METTKTKTVTVEAIVNTSIENVWFFWTKPEHIKKWNNASDDWHTPWAKNDLRIGGKFISRMEAKDGSAGFSFGGTYTEVKRNELISSVLDDGRKVRNTFEGNNYVTVVSVTFETENTNSVELQRSGWQAILNNFKKYAESNSEKG